MDNRTIIPTKLYRVKIFESRTFFMDEDGGRLRVDERSTDDIETQIERWVRQTGSLVVSTGAVSLTFQPGQRVRTLKADESVQITADMEIRSLPVIYTPPVESDADAIYGQQSTQQPVQQYASEPEQQERRPQTEATREVHGEIESGSSVTARRISDGGMGDGRAV